MLDRAVCESLTKTIICLVMCVFPSMYILSFLSNPCYDIVAWLSFKDAPPRECSFWPVSSRTDFLRYTLYFYKNILKSRCLEFRLFELQKVS